MDTCKYTRYNVFTRLSISIQPTSTNRRGSRVPEQRELWLVPVPVWRVSPGVHEHKKLSSSQRRLSFRLSCSLWTVSAVKPSSSNYRDL